MGQLHPGIHVVRVIFPITHTINNKTLKHNQI
jgi:hypothetical protein